MSTTVAVSKNTPIYPAGVQSALTIKNVGETSVSLDNAPTNGSGYPLGAGSSMVWDASKPLYAYCATQGSLLILENAGNLFDAQAVASSLIDSNLAVDIASAIKLEGVNAVAESTLVLDGAFVGGAVHLLTNMAQYSGIVIEVTSSSTNAFSNVGYVTVLRPGNSPGPYLNQKFYVTGAGITRFVIPTANPIISLELADLTGIAPAYIQVFGIKGRSVVPNYECNRYPRASDGAINLVGATMSAGYFACSLNATAAGKTAVICFPTYAPGECEVYLDGSHNIGGSALVDELTVSPFLQPSFLASGSSVRFYTPSFPWRFQIACPAGMTYARISIRHSGWFNF